MSKQNTIYAAVLAASMLVFPVSAGQPGPQLKGGPVYTPPVKTTTYSAADAHASSYAYSSSKTVSSYASAGSTSGTSYTYSHKGEVPHYKQLTLTGPGDVITDNIVCVLHGQEVPCDTIPGLADALRAQGMHSLASKLPQVPLNAHGNCGIAPAPCGQVSYTGCATTSYQTPVCGQSHGTHYQQHTYSAPVNSGYGPYGTQYYGAAGTVYGAYAVTSVPQPVLTPCGQVVGVTCGAIAPLTVQLSNGTVYALGGGVGTGVYGEFYGGGGTLIEGGGSYSGVTNAYGFHYGNSLSYQKGGASKPTHPNPKPRVPRPPKHDGGKGGHHGGKGGGCGGHC